MRWAEKGFHPFFEGWNPSCPPEESHRVNIQTKSKKIGSALKQEQTKRFQGLDEMLPRADEVKTRADKVLSSLHEVKTSLDEVLQRADEVLQRAVKVLPSPDKVLLSLDEVKTRTDEVKTRADEVLPSLDKGEYLGSIGSIHGTVSILLFSFVIFPKSPAPFIPVVFNIPLSFLIK